jgi:hypothetical protein
LATRPRKRGRACVPGTEQIPRDRIAIGTAGEELLCQANTGGHQYLIGAPREAPFRSEVADVLASGLEEVGKHLSIPGVILGSAGMVPNRSRERSTTCGVVGSPVSPCPISSDQYPARTLASDLERNRWGTPILALVRERTEPLAVARNPNGSSLCGLLVRERRFV